MTRIPYPLFVPPEPLATKPREEWRMKEARWYKDWLLGCMPQRIAALLRYFGFDRHSLPPRELVLRLGEKVAEALFDDEFSQPGGEGKRVLTNAGAALAADMGLLLAQLLIDEFGAQLRWEIIRKPKRELSYNLPVLMPFQMVYYEPIRGSLAVARSILLGERSGDEWAKGLDQLRSMVVTA